MSSTDNLMRKARFLRNAAPQQFADFHGAFAEYARAAAEIMVMTTENLQLYQGHAQQCVKILKALEDAKNG
jgi:hypothetical protein